MCMLKKALNEFLKVLSKITKLTHANYLFIGMFIGKSQMKPSSLGKKIATKIIGIVIIIISFLAFDIILIFQTLCT